jgi:hypothetical protein
MKIAGNQLGFHLLDAIPKSRTFNATDCRDTILRTLISLGLKFSGRKLVIHADNAKVQTARNCIAIWTKTGPPSGALA